MEYLKELLSHCNASVSISCNNHKDVHETVEQYLADEKQEINDFVFSEMVKKNTVIEVQFYPDTPIGFYKIYHYDIDQAMLLALNIIKSA